MSEAEREQTVEWLDELLEERSKEEALRGRMRRAGNLAYSLARLRAEKQKVGFLPLPFGEYLQGLAKVAGIAIAPVLEWAAVDDPSALDPTEATRIGRLAKALGFHLEELILSFRIGVAERASGAPLPMLAAYRESSGAVTAPQCDRVLRQIEAGWSRELKVELSAITNGASSGYLEHAKEQFGVHK